MKTLNNVNDNDWPPKYGPSYWFTRMSLPYGQNFKVLLLTLKVESGQVRVKSLRSPISNNRLWAVISYISNMSLRPKINKIIFFWRWLMTIWTQIVILSKNDPTMGLMKICWAYMKDWTSMALWAMAQIFVLIF